jgi:hypothetical protein
MVGEPVLQKLKVILWSVERGRGAVRDQQGIEYRLFRRDLAAGVENLSEDEIVEGVVEDFDRVNHVQPIGWGEERPQFETVGPVPESQGKGWTPGVAGTLEDLNPDRPRKDPLMSRIISKAACPNKADLESWLRYETGGYVSMIGEPIDRGLNWEIKVFSPDGKPEHEGATFASFEDTRRNFGGR